MSQSLGIAPLAGLSFLTLPLKGDCGLINEKSIEMSFSPYMRLNRYLEAMTFRGVKASLKLFEALFRRNLLDTTLGRVSNALLVQLRTTLNLLTLSRTSGTGDMAEKDVFLTNFRRPIFFNVLTCGGFTGRGTISGGLLLRISLVLVQRRGVSRLGMGSKVGTCVFGIKLGLTWIFTGLGSSAGAWINFGLMWMFLNRGFRYTEVLEAEFRDDDIFVLF